MLTKIILDNFKLYKESTSFDNLKQVNILTGINGRGKSTFLQSLLLMKQSILQNIHTTSLLLNGDYISLGNAFDVKNINVSRNKPICFEFYQEEYGIHYLFDAQENKQQLELSTCFLSDSHGNILSPFFAKDKKQIPMLNLLPALQTPFNTFFANIQYISAERLGPQLHYPISNDKRIVGAKGEYAASQFHFHQSEILPKAYFEELENIFDEIDIDFVDKTIGGQVEFWLSKMFASTTIETSFVEEANVVTLKMSTVQNGPNRMKTTNVGFGYTYVFPILIAGLTGKENDTFIIENPEAHLHPAAQSIIAKFLALISQLGIQVFVETHSEHILNAFRVLMAQRCLTKEDIKIMFFDQFENGYYETIEIKDNGKIINWPPYFFDQSERDLNILLGGL